MLNCNSNLSVPITFQTLFGILNGTGLKLSDKAMYIQVVILLLRTYYMLLNRVK